MNWDLKYYPEFWDGRKLAYPHVPKESPKFARSIVAGNLIFVSGCTGQDTITGKPTARSFEGQMKMALQKVKMAMEEAGSSMENIVKTVMLLKNRDDYPRMRRAEVEYYLKHAPFLVDNPPASTFIVPASLAKPEFLIEMDVIGVIRRHQGDWNVSYYDEYWDGRKLAYPHVPKEHPKFARTEVVGNLVMVSGCTGQDTLTGHPTSKRFEGQVNMALRKLRIALRETGGSMENIVKTYVLLRDMKDLPVYRKLEREFFAKHAPAMAGHPPASTVIQASSLALPEFLVETEAFGVVDRKAPGWETAYYPGDQDASGGAAAGRLLFLSGCDGTDVRTGKARSDDVEKQVHAALDKVKDSLERAGGSLEKIVKTFMLLNRLSDYPKMRKAETEYYEEHAPYLVAHPPVSTFLQLSSLRSPGALFEVDVTAVL
jgi:2-iminobutanoate/2-iminopropanoate deaminase